MPDLDDPRSKSVILFRERLVQPVPVLHYSDIVPEMRTPVDGLLLANTSQIINTNLNNNAMVKIAREAVRVVSEHSCSLSSLPGTKCRRPIERFSLRS